MHILFVCTGNTCRSSMAEAILKHRIKNNGEEFSDVTVSSAGVSAYPGDSASPNAVKALAEMGIDLAGHSASLLTEDMIKNADLILTMTEGHKRMVLVMDPSSSDKVWTLKEFVGIRGNIDILDPYGMDLNTYKKSAAEIKELIDALELNRANLD